jgi:hypothetical protein
MTRRTTLLALVAVLSTLAVAALPRIGFAQSDPFIGTWQLNLAKSKFNPNPAPRSQTVNFQAEGQNHKITIGTVDATGKSTTTITIRVYDGMPHPVTGNPDYDSEVATRAAPNTVILNRTKAGKLVQTGTMTVSADGKSRSLATNGIDANGREVSNIQVFDKQ